MSTNRSQNLNPVLINLRLHSIELSGNSGEENTHKLPLMQFDDKLPDLDFVYLGTKQRHSPKRHSLAQRNELQKILVATSSGDYPLKSFRNALLGSDM